jgi:beta-phosphoglucomutase
MLSVNSMAQSGRVVHSLIFDLDGTLVSTREANYRAYRKAFAREGIRLYRKQYLQCFGLSFADLVKIVAPNLSPKAVMRVRRAKVGFYREELVGIKVNKELLGLIRGFRRNFKLGLVTTASRPNVRLVLRAIGFSRVFDCVICGEDVEEGKPSPEGYLLCMRRLGVRPANCLVFEDSDVGSLAALRAGAAVVRVNER